MSTGYRGGVTTPELWSLEERVARLEKELAERQRKAADRRGLLQFVGYSLLVGVFIAVLIVVVGRLS